MERHELTRREALGLMGVTAAAGGFAVLTGSASATTRPSSLLRANAGAATSIDLGTNGDANNVNPILAVDSDGYWRTDLMFTPMVLVDPTTLDATPSLARSWTISPDGTTYTFHLDSRAMFQDGTPLTAADVEFTVLSMLAPHYTGPFQTYWSRLKGAEDVISGSAKTLPGLQVLDDHTVKMVLSAPYAGFLTVIARQLKPLPSHLLAGDGNLTTSSPYSLHPIGSGQYLFDDWKVNTQFQAKYWPQYWATPARMQLVTQTIIPDQTTITDGLESGQLDGSITPPPSSIPQLRQNPALRVFAVAPEYPEALWFNMRKEPWKSNVKLRQAIAYAVDFVAFQRAFMFLTNPHPSSFYSYASWAYNAEAGAVPSNNMALAAKLLAEAGYPGGKGLELTVTTNTGNTYRAQEQTYLQAQLAKLGVKVNVIAPEWSEFISSVLDGKFDMAAVNIGSAIPDPTAADASYITKGAANYSGYSNPQLDDILARAGAITNEAERKGLYAEAQRILVRDLPCIPTCWYPNFLVIKTKYTNVDPSVIGPTWNIGDYGETA